MTITVKALLEALNGRYRENDDARYHAIIYIVEAGPTVTDVETGDEIESRGFDIIGPVDIDPAVAIVSFLEKRDGPLCVVHKLRGRPRDVFINQSLQHWQDQQE